MVEQRNSLAFSMLLHLGVVLLAAFGLPQILPKKPDPMPLVMSVEILPIGGETNVKPSDQKIQEEKHAPTPVIKKPVPPTAKDKPAEPEKPKPIEKPTPKTSSQFDPMEEAEPLPDAKPKDEKKDEKKPDKPKDEKTPDKAKDKAKSEDFAALLSKLKQESAPDKSSKAKDTTNQVENKTTSTAPYDASKPLAISEIDAIRGQFIPCWRMPIGAKDPQSLAARVHITLQADGAVLTAELAADQRNRYAADPFFRAAADAAIRAAHQCSPLKNLPADKYNSWRDIELNFNPADLM